MMRIKLLNDGGYRAGDSAVFPVVVNAVKNIGNNGCNVTVADLKNVGFVFEDRDRWSDEDTLYFSVSAGECEVTTNEC